MPDPRTLAWEWMLQRLEGFSTKGSEPVTMIHDEGDNSLIRKAPSQANCQLSRRQRNAQPARREAPHAHFPPGPAPPFDPAQLPRAKDNALRLRLGIPDTGAKRRNRNDSGARRYERTLPCSRSSRS